MKFLGELIIKERDRNSHTILSYERVKNIMVDAGAEKIANYIAGVSVSDSFDYMAIGNGSDTVKKSDKTLTNEITRELITSNSGKIEIIDDVIDDGIHTVQFTHIFPADPLDSDRATISEFGIFDASTGGNMLNHIVSTSLKDNQANDLECIYRLNVNY